MSNENETQTSAEVTSPITDEMVEAAAAAIGALRRQGPEHYYRDARAALEAALPALRRQIAGEIAVAIEEAAASIYFGNRYALHEAVEVAREHAAR